MFSYSRLASTVACSGVQVEQLAAGYLGAASVLFVQFATIVACFKTLRHEFVIYESLMSGCCKLCSWHSLDAFIIDLYNYKQVPS